MIRCDADGASLKIMNDGERSVVAVGGVVDLETTPRLQRCLLTAARSAETTLVVDLSETSLLTCRGLTALAATADALRDCGRTMVVTGARGVVRRVLAISDLSRFLDDDAPNSGSDRRLLSLSTPTPSGS